MKSRWRDVRLTDICRPKQWATISRNDLLDDGYPVYGANGIIGYYSEYNHEKETILITCRGATCGRINVCQPFSYVTGNAMALNDLNDKVVDRSFLTLLLKRRGFSDVISGTAQPQITRQGLELVNISIPPIEAQRRIAAILDKADAIRRKHEQALALADDFLRFTFLHMFGDPVTNPKGWQVQPLGVVAELINGDRSSNYPNQGDITKTGILFLGTPNLSNGGLDLSETRFITKEKFNSLGRGKLKRQDLIITLRGSLGVCSEFDCAYDTGFINAQMMIIRTKRVPSRFLLFLMKQKSLQDRLRKLGSGSAIPQLTAAQLGALDIMLPPDHEQRRFLAIERCVNRQISHYSDKLRYAECLFASLSQCAFRGEL